MPESIHCPKCTSANVIFSKKRGMNVCEDCGHEFAQERSVVLLRTFVSDGGWERYLIVIDALDEAGEAGRNLLVEMLARNASACPTGWLSRNNLPKQGYDYGLAS